MLLTYFSNDAGRWHDLRVITPLIPNPSDKGPGGIISTLLPILPMFDFISVQMLLIGTEQCAVLQDICLESRMRRDTCIMGMVRTGVVSIEFLVQEFYHSGELSATDPIVLPHVIGNDFAVPTFAPVIKKKEITVIWHFNQWQYMVYGSVLNYKLKGTKDATYYNLL